ncbi:MULTISPECIES: ABC transporter substrate-binding protein [Thermomonosporaceae]|uniref:ABC transporter substrate-binding protein n=1 Tax=Thermomonosporaceae TaxID=2012 RepID=UPI00255AC04D|nr:MULTISPECIES: ABC transporter substrate-binding protein [Thermomonosporaceae]MDL4774156.1 ABC transporter substrate-binding protein [Actinomadura xylanilytica]
MQGGMVLVLGIALSACGGGGGTKAAGEQTLKVGVDSLPASQGNPFNSAVSPGVYTYAAIYDPLTFVDATGQVKPWLATEWKNTSDTTWNFTIRDGVTFSNGETLTAQGVADVANYLKQNPEVKQSVVANDLATIKSAKALDGKTVEFTTSVKDPVLPNKLTELLIPAPKALAEGGVKGIAAKPVGTGPFQVENWGGNKITFTAFEKSWRAPKAGGLEIQAMQDPASRLQALQSGQVDLITGVSPDQVDQMKGATQAEVSLGNQVMSLAFRTVKGKDPVDSPLTDKKVRQALNYAVNKQGIADNLLLGKAEPVGQGPTEKVVGHNPDVQAYPYDPAKAKALLAEAGHPNGFAMSADVVVGSFPADADIYQAVKQDLAKVGVNLTLNQMTFPNWMQRYTGNSWKTEAFGLSWNALPTMDPTRAMTNFTCLRAATFFCDKPTADHLSAALTNMDADKRAAQLRKVVAEMHENPPALYLVHQITIVGKSAGLEGAKDDNRFFRYDQMVKK